MKKFTEWLKLNNLYLFNEQDPTSVFKQSDKYNKIRTFSKMAYPKESDLELNLKDTRYSTIPNYSKDLSHMYLMGTGGRSLTYNTKPYSTTEPKFTPSKDELDLMIPNFTGPSTSQIIKSLNEKPDKTSPYVARTKPIKN